MSVSKWSHRRTTKRQSTTDAFTPIEMIQLMLVDPTKETTIGKKRKRRDFTDSEMAQLMLIDPDNQDIKKKRHKARNFTESELLVLRQTESNLNHELLLEQEISARQLPTDVLKYISQFDYDFISMFKGARSLLSTCRKLFGFKRLEELMIGFYNSRYTKDVFIQKRSSSHNGKKKDTEMQIFVKVFAGRTFSILVEPSDTIDIVKQKIQDNEGFVPNQDVFVFAGKQLGKVGSLSDCGIGRDSILQLVPLDFDEYNEFRNFIANIPDRLLQAKQALQEQSDNILKLCDGITVGLDSLSHQVSIDTLVKRIDISENFFTKETNSVVAKIKRETGYTKLQFNIIDLKECIESPEKTNTQLCLLPHLDLQAEYSTIAKYLIDYASVKNNNDPGRNYRRFSTTNEKMLFLGKDLLEKPLLCEQYNIWAAEFKRRPIMFPFIHDSGSIPGNKTIISFPWMTIWNVAHDKYFNSHALSIAPSGVNESRKEPRDFVLTMFTNIKILCDVNDPKERYNYWFSAIHPKALSLFRTIEGRWYHYCHVVYSENKYSIQTSATAGLKLTKIIISSLMNEKEK